MAIEKPPAPPLHRIAPGCTEHRPLPVNGRPPMPAPKPELLLQLSRVKRKLKNRVEISPLEKLWVYQHLSRVWRRYLNPHEIVVAYYVVDRTIGWGNSYFAATSANVLIGTDDYAGIGIPARTYFRTLKSMEASGFLYRKAMRDKTLLELNLDWQPWNRQ